MPRRRVVREKRVAKDSKYNDPLVGKCINNIMKKGKKSIAEKIMYGAFEIIKEKANKDPLEVFHKAVKNLRPQLEVKSRRVGGSTYQVPVEVRPERQISLALRWLVSYAKQRNDKKRMVEKLAAEILDAYQNRGAAIKKKEDTHRMAEANKAFAHYRW